jgi:hypothetical protein
MFPAAAATSHRALLRNFIASSLYDKTHGYFCKGGTGGKIGRVRTPLPFAALSGREEFRARVVQLYDGLDSSWLTPSELFSPFYGAAGNLPSSMPLLPFPPPPSLRLINCAVARWAAENVLGLHHVIEVGPGNGTFAADFLQAMRLRYGGRDW